LLELLRCIFAYICEFCNLLQIFNKNIKFHKLRFHNIPFWLL